MTYVLITIAVLVTALLLLRLRLRLEFSSERRLLFIGIGRSGPELDFSSRRGVLRLFGWEIRQFRIGRAKSIGDAIKSRIKSTEPEKADAKKTKPKRKRTWRGWQAILPQSLRAVGRYVLDLFKSAIVEQAEAEIEAGFESPSLTGELFGYYQAVQAALPGLGRIQFIPDWTGPSFSGSAQFAVAWPVYRLVWQTTRLVFRLPVMKIVKLAIGKKEGAQDG